ncbi:DUF3375 domain-containing protein [Microbacterium tenebrionis]|uniref:DUF3375 domain-containing protein n=1 Tax=Microbacterium tenebrionis TaxID=2830665 RepID=UPI00158EE90F|nr:DUF3375 domain-containing protein [Microbacterium ihumii]
MTALVRAHALSRLLDEHVAWRMLRADMAPVIVAILSDHLGGEERRIESEDLYERIDADLDELRAHGFDLPGTAKAYCAQWRASGYLVRRPAETSRGETFELSPAALTATRFLAQLAQPRQSATESRLTSIAAQLHRLAVDSDPDARTRIARLEEQRAQIDAEIEAIGRGEAPPLDQERAVERVRDVLAMAEDIPSDFARVRAEFEGLNRDLRARVLESDAAQRAVLDDIFRGVNMIDESDAGRSFSGFAGLVLDPERGEEFEEDIRRVLERDFTNALSAAERRFLRRLLRTLKERSGEIHDVITTFARGLRRYVQSQEYERDRVLRRELRGALATGRAASGRIKPYKPTRVGLSLSAVPMHSAGSLRLHDPAAYDAPEEVVTHEAAAVSIEELRALARETEIDFDELTGNINAALQDVDEISIAEVLARFPATQGVASVVGLLALGAAQGAASASEHVEWVGSDAVARAAWIPSYRFTGRVL